MENIYKKCNLCHRFCLVNRYEKKGICGVNNKIKIAKAALFFYEEPCLSGKKGSGAIFFSGCNLKCLFCQNKEISSKVYGKEITISKFSDICLDLERKGAHNINLVTPTHFVPSIIKGIKKARNNGLSIPIIYNTSTYENIDTIRLLNKTVDIYLPDLKYYDNCLAKKYSHVDNYFEVATINIKEMYKQVGKNIFDKNGMMLKGIIVRILVLPGEVEDAKKIIEYLYKEYHDDIYISIMNQYTPLTKIDKYPNLNRKLSESEYDEVVNFAYDLGVRNAFIQEGETQKESFIPEFDLEGID